MSEIETEAKVCGRGRCTRVRAKVDTGAFATLVSEDVAKQANIRETGNRISAKGVSKRGIMLREGEATICLKGRCGCRKQRVYIAESGVLNDGMLLGMDYLEAAKATIDAAGKKLRCGRKGRRSCRS